MWHEIDTRCSLDVLAENEKPGSAATETGADFKVWFDWIDDSTKRESAARALLAAVLACDPRDRVPLLERFAGAMRAGRPTTGFGPIMVDAREWAALATRAEAKAYCLACFEAMNGRNQAALLSHIDRRVAA